MRELTLLEQKEFWRQMANAAITVLPNTILHGDYERAMNERTEVKRKIWKLENADYWKAFELARTQPIPSGDPGDDIPF